MNNNTIYCVLTWEILMKTVLIIWNIITSYKRRWWIISPARKKRSAFTEDLWASDQTSREIQQHTQKQCDLLRSLENLEKDERTMYELDNRKDQVMTVFKVALANLAMWTRDQYFPASYSNATWERLAPFFRLPGIVRSSQKVVEVELRPFNDRQYNRDLHLLCQRVNQKQPHLPDGRLLTFSVWTSNHPVLDGQVPRLAWDPDQQMSPTTRTSPWKACHPTTRTSPWKACHPTTRTSPWKALLKRASCYNKSSIACTYSYTSYYLNTYFFSLFTYQFSSYIPTYIYLLSTPVIAKAR